MLEDIGVVSSSEAVGRSLAWELVPGALEWVADCLRSRGGDCSLLASNRAWGARIRESLGFPK